MQVDLLTDMRRHPVLWSVLGAAIGCYVLLSFAGGPEMPWLLRQLTIVDVGFHRYVDLEMLLEQGQYWRWFTPALIHFSFVHIFFNWAIGLMVGRNLEIGIGHAGFALLILWLVLVSNLTQVMFNDNAMFGGLSGVVYGFVAFTAVMERLQPSVLFWRTYPGLVMMLGITLVIFSTGVTEAFGLYIANAAHWGGVAAGVLAALIYGLLCRAR